MFTSQQDDDPTANTLTTDVGLTEVEILDFEDTEYINFEAEINFPEEEGIVQVENFGMREGSRPQLLKIPVCRCGSLNLRTSAGERRAAGGS